VKRKKCVQKVFDRADIVRDAETKAKENEREELF
jgi:hypothetical protein